MIKYVQELVVYIAHNAFSIVNYGERYRFLLRIQPARPSRSGFKYNTCVLSILS
jgi:hypothetical protein